MAAGAGKMKNNNKNNNKHAWAGVLLPLN